MTLKIIEPIKEYLKVFNSPDEFNIWYTKNKDEVDMLTTHKLNKMYKINGYRITKIKNVLMLKKITNNDSQHNVNSPLVRTESSRIAEQSVPDDQRSCSELRSNAPQGFGESVAHDINELHEEIKNIKSTINQIIQYLNPQTLNDVSPPSTT